MNIEDAYRLLGLTPTSTETERYAAYEETRNRLEAKMVKAPTPGLKEKYRESLRQMEQAVEAIEISLDGGDLPTLTPQTSDTSSAAVQPTSPAPRPAVAPAPTRGAHRKSYKGEIWAAVVVVAIIVTGGLLYMNGENAKSTVINDLPTLGADIESSMQKLVALQEEAAELELPLGEEITALVANDLTSQLNGSLARAERFRDAEDWGAAYDEMQSARQTLAQLGQTISEGTKEYGAEKKKLVDEAVNNFEQNLKSLNFRGLELALDSGLSLDIKSVGGCGALGLLVNNVEYAASEYWSSQQLAGAVRTVQKILSRPDVDVNSSCSDPLTNLYTLMWSVEPGQFRTSIMKSLIARPDYEIKTSLRTAAYRNDVETIDLLLQRDDINVNLISGDKSALMVASDYQLAGPVRRLLAHPGIDLYILDQEGRSALDLAENPSYKQFNPFGESFEQYANKAEVVRMLKNAMGR